MAAEVTVTVNAQDNFSGVLGNFGNIMTGIQSTINLVGDAFRTVVGFGQQFIDSATDSQLALADLDAVLTSTAGAAGVTREMAIGLADAFQAQTRFSDEAILSGEAMLLTFTNIGADVFPMATEAMLNMAEKFGGMEAASVQLGKALNDPIAGVTALRRVGVQLTEAQEEQIRLFMEAGDIMSAQKIILGELETEFGGLAVAIGDTFAGRLEIAKNKFDEMREAIGFALLPALTELLGLFSEFLNQDAVIQFVDDFSAGISTLASNLVDFVSNPPNFDEFLNGFVTMVENIDWQGLSQSLAAGINSIDWSLIGQGFVNLVNAIDSALMTIVENVDWQALGDSLGNAFADVVAGLYGYADWDALAVDISAGFEYALVSAFGYMRFEDLATDFVNGFRYIGQQIASAFGYYGWDAWNQLWTDFQRGWNYTLSRIKSLLGIQSPSTVFASIARDLVQGLINGWNGLFDNFLDAVSSGIEAILTLFAPILALFGFSIPGGGTTGGGSTGGTTGGGTGNRTTPPGDGTGGTGEAGNVYNFYGDVYFGEPGTPGTNGTYVCLPTQIDVGGLGGSPSGGTSGSTGGRPGRPR